MNTAQHWRLRPSAVIFLFAFCIPAFAGIQYWNPTTTPKGAGNGVWDTGVGAWANTSAGTTTPVPWVNGNNAWFNLNSGVNVATVNGVSAGLLYFQDGTFTFQPGTGPLTLTGPLTNINALVTFNADVVLAANQNWQVSGKQTTVNGTLTGPYTLKKTGAGSPALVLSNANNNVAGFFVDSGNLNAYAGGNALGGSNSTLTVGSPVQSLVAKVSINPLVNQPETSWAVGPLVANGYGEVSFVSDGTKTNNVTFGSLSRTNRGVVGLRQSGGNFEIRQKVTFTNGAQIVVNGMLPPWVVTPTSGDFLAYNGLVKTLVYKTTAPNTWTVSDVVNNTSVQTLAADTAVHALRVSSDLTVPVGLTLTNASGGIILIGKTISGNGTLATGPNDLIVYATGTSALYPRISANGLTVWGGGTLTVSNITWSGDTYIHQGILKSIIAENTVLDGRSINGLGEFIKEGSANLSLLNSTGTVGKITLNGTGAFSVSNSYFGTKATIMTGTGKNDISINIMGGGPGRSPTVLDGGLYGLTLGNAGARNSLLVNGGGVTGGAVFTNMIYNKTGLTVGTGANAASNTVTIANGGAIWDQITISNAGNGIGIGTGANGNKISIIGGNGFVSMLYKSFANVIGSGAATGNAVLVDGAGYPGSALFSAGGELILGSGGAYGNQLTITNGGIYRYSSITVSGTRNRIDVVGQGSQLYGNGSNHALYFGTGNSTGNVMRVSDGGLVKDFTVWEHYIGGGHDATGKNVDNLMIVGSGGTVNTPKPALIGQAFSASSIAMSNRVQVTGTDAQWLLSSDSWLAVGKEAGGGKAIGNELRVENGGVLRWTTTFANHGLIVGSMADATAGGQSSGNRVVVANGGQVLFAVQLQVGSVPGATVGVASNNSVWVTSGGVLEADKLVVGANANNTIAATGGGIFQFTTPTPTITSLTPGDISINSGVIAFKGQTVLANVRGNQSGSQLVNMSWNGSNAFRLNNSQTTTSSSQTYVFDPSLGATNYFRLEMVDGTTRYRGTAGNTLTIGQSVGSGGEMLCSNTTASVEMPFVLNGDLTLFNSTLTLQQTAEINGDVFIDMDNLPASGTPLVAQGALTLGGSSGLHLNGTPVDGTVLVAASGSLTGRFTIDGLPSNYTLHYGSDGTISLLHSPTILVIR